VRLITIPMSHYCEKARWALERLDINYHEERHLQGFHYLRTYAVSGGRIVPVLVDGDQVITDSTRILQHLEQYATGGKRLYPDDPEECARVEQLEDLYDEVLGVESRRWVYHHMQGRPKQALSIAGQGTPIIEKLLMPLAYLPLLILIKKRLKPDKAAVENGLNRIRNIIKETDSLLAAGNRYLTGPEFTAADLSLACMLAPLVLPVNYGIKLPDIEEMPPAAQPAISEFKNTDTGQYVLHLFESEKPLREVSLQ